MDPVLSTCVIHTQTMVSVDDVFVSHMIHRSCKGFKLFPRDGPLPSSVGQQVAFPPLSYDATANPLSHAFGDQPQRVRHLVEFVQDGMIPLNRDNNGATNIGINFTRLMADQPPIRSITDEDLAFHRASLCMECD